MNSEHEKVSLLKWKEITAHCDGSHKKSVSDLSPALSSLGFWDSVL